MRDLQEPVDVLAVEVRAVVKALLQSAAFSKIAKADVVDDRNESQFQVGQRRPIAKAKLVERPSQLRHQLLDARVDVLPALLQKEIRVPAEELQIILENTVNVDKCIWPLRQMLIGFNAGGVSHLCEQQMSQIEHLRTFWDRDQRVLVLRESAAVRLIQRITD